MPSALPFLLLSVLAAPPPETIDGVWLPMTGSAGERAVQSLAPGPDGLLWAAGGGQAHRLEAGRPWRHAGRYAPEIDWDGGQRISVRGALPGEMLRRVIDDIREAIESAGGVDAEEGTVGGEAFDEFIAAFVEEAEQAADSPYRVHATVAGNKLVWIGTGAGLFRATARGVQGPLAGVPGPVVSLASGDLGVYAATPKGLFRFDPTGAVRPIVQADVRAVAVPRGDEVVYVADGHLWRWTEVDGTRALQTPPLEPRLLAARAGRLYVAGDAGVYRVADDGTWTACDALPEPAAKLVADDEGLAAVTEDALHLASPECRGWSALPVPWPGGMRLLDAARAGGSWFMSSSIGVFVLTPAVAEAEEALAVTGFQRALAQMPTFDEVVQLALEASGLDPKAAVVGARASLSHLLPRLTAELTYDARRVENIPTLGASGQSLVLEEPRANFAVVALWSVPLDSVTRSFSGLLGDLEGGDQADLTTTERADDDSLDDATGPDADPDADLRADEAATEDVVDGDVAEAPETPDGDPTDADTTKSALSEQRLRAKERVSLLRRLQRLYRQRQGTLYRLWTSAPTDLRGRVLLLLELEELDANLDAHTGGAYGQRLARRAASP